MNSLEDRELHRLLSLIRFADQNKKHKAKQQILAAYGIPNSIFYSPNELPTVVRKNRLANPTDTEFVF